MRSAKRVCRTPASFMSRSPASRTTSTAPLVASSIFMRLPSLAHLGGAQDFLERGHAGPHAGQALLAQRRKAVLAIGRLQPLFRGALENEPAQRVGHPQHLEDAGAPAIARLAALLAALPAGQPLR